MAKQKGYASRDSGRQEKGGSDSLGEVMRRMAQKAEARGSGDNAGGSGGAPNARAPQFYGPVWEQNLRNDIAAFRANASAPDPEVSAAQLKKIKEGQRERAKKAMEELSSFDPRINAELRKFRDGTYDISRRGEYAAALDKTLFAMYVVKKMKEVYGMVIALDRVSLTGAFIAAAEAANRFLSPDYFSRTPAGNMVAYSKMDAIFTACAQEAGMRTMRMAEAAKSMLPEFERRLAGRSAGRSAA